LKNVRYKSKLPSEKYVSNFDSSLFIDDSTLSNLLDSIVEKSNVSFFRILREIQKNIDIFYNDADLINQGLTDYQELSVLFHECKAFFDNGYEQNNQPYWYAYANAMRTWNDREIQSPFDTNKTIKCPFTWYGENFDAWFDQAKIHFGYEKDMIFKDSEYFKYNFFLIGGSLLSELWTLWVIYRGFKTDDTSYYTQALPLMVFSISFTSLAILYNAIQFVYFVAGTMAFVNLNWFGSVEILVYVYYVNESNEIKGVDGCTVHVENMDAYSELPPIDIWKDRYWSTERQEFYYEVGKANVLENSSLSKIGFYSLNERPKYNRWVKAVPAPGQWNIYIEPPIDIFEKPDPLLMQGPFESQSTNIIQVEIKRISITD
jgi:hypothetical protein